jgi:ABC-type transport system involved in multi-copper enzyme maturation permease subunit
LSRTLFRYTVREITAGWIRRSVLACLWLLPFVGTVVEPHPHPAGTWRAFWLVLILSAGLIGRETSTGVLPLVFSRPINRASFVLTKWAAVVAVCAGLLVLQSGVETVILVVRKQPPLFFEVLYGLGDSLLFSGGLAAVFVLLSSLVPSYGDAGLLAFAYVVVQILSTIADQLKSKTLTTVAGVVGLSLFPSVDLELAFASAPIGWSSLTRYALTVLAALSLAVLVMNTRQFSYASD